MEWICKQKEPSWSNNQPHEAKCGSERDFDGDMKRLGNFASVEMEGLVHNQYQRTLHVMGKPEIKAIF